MKWFDPWRRGILRAAEGEGGGGGGDGNGGGAGGGTPEAKWHQDAHLAPHREWLVAKGLDKVDDAAAALKALVSVGVGAEAKLGRSADTLMDRPAKDTPLAEWMRANAEVFGLPEAAEKYELERPEMPKGIEWDAELEAQARAAAFEHGVPPAAFQAMAKVYGERIAKVTGDIEAQATAANQEMMAALERDWGQSMGARLAQAKVAAQMIGEAAGLDGAAIEAISGALKPKVGDAGVIKLFAAIGAMIGEDQLVGLGKGAGGTTPEDARAKLAAMDREGGEWWKASKANDRREMDRLRPVRDLLLKLAAGGA